MDHRFPGGSGALGRVSRERARFASSVASRASAWVFASVGVWIVTAPVAPFALAVAVEADAPASAATNGEASVTLTAQTLEARLAALPAGPDKDAVMLGYHLSVDTPHYARGHVPGGAISCASCHIGAGTTPHASPWYGMTGVTPAYTARSASVESLAQRINNCFRRSENGTPLALDSAEMNGFLAYMTFVSQGVPSGAFGPGRGMGKIANVAKMTPDPVHGKAIYGERCASCHGANGQGVQSGGRYAFPPLWGDASFNIGASMARIGTAAAFIKHNMPLGNPNLSDQDALDVAAYVTHQPRPDFPGKENDWPKGGKPADARY
ncbi:MAG TPA: c-type cytochrome [Trinickia sp.]|uniref:c-type cytochrome n=1 Tax=Trinickia sp. TaxID=2571163 RepID=UPI002C33A209|nr:c-type cytochrome [Trinickia sp.]HVW49882.1 c-type cytochrome [Trinickia sp.]